MTRVALATSAEIPDGDEDFPALLEALAHLEIAAEAAVWDAPADWAAFDLVVVRATWDYAERRDEFLDWARSLPRVLNDIDVLEWNPDKQRYLTDLADSGVPTVPTRFVEPGEPFDPPGEPFVVKPSVSAGGRSSARFEPGDAEAAGALVDRIHAGGRTAMVQPFLPEDEEKGLVFIGDAFSHALRRRVPLPAGSERAVFYLDEGLGPASASGAERQIAEAALACAPGELLYGRVDLLGGVVLELEVAEPSLYLGFDPSAPARLAAAISQRLRISPENGRTTSQ
jgi:glutathione synthase/RimK-type ligase-like ATP-grasp enzyme